MTDKQVDRLWALEHFNVFSPLKVFTPIHIGYKHFKWTNGGARRFKSLFIFGVRVARWRIIP